MTADKGGLELAAMVKVKEALDGLQADSRQRVIEWAAGLFQVEKKPIEQQRQDQKQRDPKAFRDVATLFTGANPQTKADMALVVAYWYQEVEGKTDQFGSQKINDQLKHLGHPDTKINRTFSDLMRQTPALVMQTHRGGKAQQSRKTYSLTAAGINRVKSLLSQRPQQG